MSQISQSIQDSLSTTKLSLSASFQKQALKKIDKLPSSGTEDWKYTRLEPVYKVLAQAKALTAASSLPEIGHNSAFDSQVSSRAVFLDGVFSSELSSEDIPGFYNFQASDIPKPLALKIAENSGRLISSKGNAFSCLTLTSAEDGAIVDFTAATVPNTVIEVVWIFSGTTPNSFITPRLLGFCEQGAQGIVVERFVHLSPATNSPATNSPSAASQDALTELDAAMMASAEFFVEENGNLQHFRFFNTPTNAFQFASTFSEQGKDSVFGSMSFNLGMPFLRSDYAAAMTGENARLKLGGLSLLGSKDRSDTSILVDHLVPHCESEQIFRGVFDEESQGAFTGRIIVHRDAQKTNAIQSNQSIVLSDKASSFTRPQLEIFADDVRCTHGATVGQLDANAMFYLQSRGINRKRAQQMLLEAFAVELPEQIENEAVRNYCEAEVAAHLKKMF